MRKSKQKSRRYSVSSQIMCENESWCQSTMMNEDDVYTKIKFIYFDDYENSSICFYIFKENFSSSMWNKYTDSFAYSIINLPTILELFQQARLVRTLKQKREALFMSRMCSIGNSNFRISQFFVCAYLFSKSKLSIKIFNQGPLLATVSS